MRTQLASEFHSNVLFTAVEPETQEKAATCPRVPFCVQPPALHQKAPLPSPQQKHLAFPNLEVLAKNIVGLVICHSWELGFHHRLRTGQTGHQECRDTSP